MDGINYIHFCHIYFAIVRVHINNFKIWKKALECQKFIKNKLTLITEQ